MIVPPFVGGDHGLQIVSDPFDVFSNCAARARALVVAPEKKRYVLEIRERKKQSHGERWALNL